MHYTSYRCHSLHGAFSIPSDKSISHRALILAAISKGQSCIENLLESEDIQALCLALVELGITIKKTTQENHIVVGQGLNGLSQANKSLYLGNSGTSARLLTGLLAMQVFPSCLTGDSSLENRPMERIATPLRAMGAMIEMTQNNTLPLQIFPATNIKKIHYSLPIASAQVKSALLLSSLYVKDMAIKEPIFSRNHTELLFKHIGIPLQVQSGWLVRPGTLSDIPALSCRIPGDFSSAAFFIVLALILPGSNIVIQNVGVNTTRTGLLPILQKMGADIRIGPIRYYAQEPVSDISVRSSALIGITIPKEHVVSAIDELPVLMIAAAFATGITKLHGANELRFKESDRIAALSEGLMSLGIHNQSFPDGLWVEGGVMKGGQVNSYGDHRIALSFLIAGFASKKPITVLACENISTSFPNFFNFVRTLGLAIQKGEDNE